MESICRFDLCLLAEDIIGNELNTPDLTKTNLNKNDYEKARYYYVYFCRTHLNASFRLIKQTMPVYKYNKTVYQVFGRAWKRRKKDDNEFMINYFKRVFETKVKDLKTQNIQVRAEGIQMKLNFN